MINYGTHIVDSQLENFRAQEIERRLEEERTKNERYTERARSHRQVDDTDETQTATAVRMNDAQASTCLGGLMMIVYFVIFANLILSGLIFPVIAVFILVCIVYGVAMCIYSCKSTTPPPTKQE